MLTPQYLLPPPEPFDYCYEWETGYGIVRKFSAAPHHGMPPTRAVALYTADQMRAALAAHVPESELRAVIDRCYAEFCGRDYMHLPLDEALRAALAAVPAQPVATSARGLLAAWQAAANVLFVSRSSGQYTTDTVSRDDLIQLIEAAFTAAPQAVPVPAGWVLVPVKPTQAMRDAMRISSRRDYPSDELCNVRYAAMLAAAPKGQP